MLNGFSLQALLCLQKSASICCLYENIAYNSTYYKSTELTFKKNQVNNSIKIIYDL